MAKQLKINHLRELIHYIISINKYEALKEYMEHQSRERNGIVKPLEYSLWEHINSYINTKKEKKHLSETVITQTVLSKSRVKRRVEVFENLITTIKQFLIRQYLEEDDLLSEWVYLKSLKNTSIAENQEQLEVVKSKIHIDQLNKATTLHQAIAYDFYKTRYQLDCLESSTPTNENLRNSQYVLQTLYSQNINEINLEFQNRKTILKESVPELFVFEEDINYATLISEIPAIPKDISGEDFILKYESFLLDASISNEKKKLLLGFLSNKSYRLYVDDGNQAPFMSFWKTYLDFGLEQKMFYNANYLNLQHYINALSILAGLDRKALSKYIEQYENDLSPQDFLIGEQLGKAFLYYYNNDFIEVITVLNKNINYGKRVELKLRYHTFRVRSAYEIFAQHKYQGKKDFDRFCISFTNYLKNKKEDLNRVWERNDKFIYWIRLIAKQNSATILKEYKVQIEQNDIIHDGWLLQKIEEKIDRM